MQKFDVRKEQWLSCLFKIASLSLYCDISLLNAALQGTLPTFVQGLITESPDLTCIAAAHWTELCQMSLVYFIFQRRPQAPSQGRSWSGSPAGYMEVSR